MKNLVSKPVLPILVALFSLPALAQKNCEEGASNMGEVLDCIYKQNEAAVQAAYNPLYAELKQKILLSRKR
jgi:hypothetical protein